MRYLLFIVLFSLSFLTAFSQIGLKAGVNVASVTSDNDVEDIKANLGYQAGIVTEFDLNNFISIRPELVWTRKGADYIQTGYDVKTKMDYIDLPILLTIHPLGGNLNFHAGPVVSYLITSKVIFDIGAPGIVIEHKESKSSFEEFDYGVALGLGYDFSNAFFDLRYVGSLKKYEKTFNVGDITVEPSSRHFLLQTSVGFYF